MLRIGVRRILVVLLLTLTLAPALSWAAERRTEPRDGAVILKSRLLPAMWRFLRAVWEEEGPSLDPDGQPRPPEGAFEVPKDYDRANFVDALQRVRTQQGR